MAGLPVAGVELLAKDAAAFQSDLAAASKAVTGFGQASEQAGGGVSAFGQIAIGALRAVGAAAVEAAAVGAKAIGAFVVDSVKQAGDFESGMLRFGSVTGDAIKEAGMSLEDFSALFLKLGADTQFSAAQAQEAAINLAKGGLTPAQIAGGALADTLTLAAAGELDLAQAAEITAKQLGVWASTGTTSAEVANLLAQAANASTVDVDELAMGMANVGGIAKTVGLSFQETVQTLGLLAPGFSSAADAGTSFKTFLTRLQPTTQPAIDAMIALNLATADGTSKFYDSQGSFIGMEQAAALLQGSLAGLTDAQKTAALQAIFGQDAFRAAAMIAEQGAAGFDAFGTAMGGVGTAAEQAAIKNQGFNFAMETLMGSLDTLKVVIGTAILPLLSAFINDVLTPGVNAVMGFAGAFLNLVPAIQASNDPLTTFFNALRVSLPEAVPLINNVQAAFTTLVTSAMAVGAAAEMLSGPWITAFQSIAPAVQTSVDSVASIISSVISTIQGTTASQLSTIQSSFLEAWTAVATTTGAVWNGLLGIINPILAAIAAFVAANGADIRATFVQVWSQVGGIVTSAMQLIQATIVPALQVIGAFVARHGEEIQAILTSTWTIVKTIITTTLGTIQGLINAALMVIRGDWQGAWNELVGIGRDQVNAIVTIVGELGKLLVAQIALAMDASIKAMTSQVGRWAAAGKDLIAGMAQGIASGASQLVSAAVGAATDALNAAQEALGISSPSREAAEKVGTPFVLGIVKGIEDSTAALQAAAKKLSKNLVKEMGVVAQEAAKAFKDMFKTGLEGDISIGKQKSQNLDTLADLVSSQEALTRLNADITKAQTAVNEARGTDKWAAAQAHLNDLLTQQRTLRQQLTQEQVLQSKAEAEFADAEARAMELRKTDAAGAEKQFALESRQIAERYQLQQELAQAQADGDNAAISRLQQQIALLATTQQQEKQLLDLTRAEQNPLTATLDKLKEIQANLVKEVERDQFMANIQKNPNQKRERQAEADTSKSLLANITALLAGITGGTIGGSGSVAPPASAAQQAAGAGTSQTTTNQYYYSPTYGTAPRNPSMDFAVMQSLTP